MKKVLALIIVLSMAIVCCACGTQRDPSGISLEEFEKINTGMGLNEVTDIIGGDGTIISESENDTDEYIEYITIYKFNGETNGSAEFTFSQKSYKDILKIDFSGPELISKSQTDLS